MHGKVIPFGYADGGTSALDRLMQGDRAHLVDIRLSARSRIPVFNEAALKARFAGRYMHLPELGNVNYKNGQPIQIADPDRGISRLMNGIDQGYTIVLMCGCKQYELCHRSVVVDLLKRAMAEVEVELPDQKEVVQ